MLKEGWLYNYLIHQLKRPSIAMTLATMQSYTIVCTSCVSHQELKYCKTSLSL